jgi:hypothetical protein
MSCPKRISEHSALAMNSALNIFSVPPTNVAIVKSHFREILPLSAVSQESPYLLRLYNDNLWTDLSRVYLFLELSIEKKNTTTNAWVPIVKADEDVGTVPLIGQCFVQQLKVSISNQDVYDSGTLYPYKAYLTHELSYPKNVKENFLASAGYYPSSKMDDADDRGFEERCKLFAEGKKAQFLSRLDFDLGNQELFLLNNLDVLFTIYRAKDAFLVQKLKTGDTNEYRLFLHNIKLFAKMIEVQPSLNLSIYQTLEGRPATYSVRKTEIKNCFLTAGRTEVEHNIFSSIIPRRLTIALVANGAFNGDATLSPFMFKPYGIRDITVQAGGQNYPAVPYNNMDFANTLCMRPFVDMYEALSSANAGHSFDISMEQFKEGWTIFVVPLTSTLDDSCGFELLRTGTTTIRMQFSAAIPAGGVEMLVLGEFDQLITIDYQRRIVTDSNIS